MFCSRKVENENADTSASPQREQGAKLTVDLQRCVHLLYHCSLKLIQDYRLLTLFTAVVELQLERTGSSVAQTLSKYSTL